MNLMKMKLYLQAPNIIIRINIIQNKHNTVINRFTPLDIPDQDVGNVRLNVFPFTNSSNIELPEGFKKF